MSDRAARRSRFNIDIGAADYVDYVLDAREDCSSWTS